MAANERNEPRGRNGSTLQRLAVTDDEREHLRVSFAERNQQSSPFGQLPKERLGNVRRTRGHQNCIVRRVVAPSESSVPRQK